MIFVDTNVFMYAVGRRGAQGIKTFDRGLAEAFPLLFPPAKAVP